MKTVFIICLLFLSVQAVVGRSLTTNGTLPNETNSEQGNHQVGESTDPNDNMGLRAMTNATFVNKACYTGSSCGWFAWGCSTKKFCGYPNRTGTRPGTGTLFGKACTERCATRCTQWCVCPNDTSCL